MVFAQIIAVGFSLILALFSFGILRTALKLRKNKKRTEHEGMLTSESGLFVRHGMVFDKEGRGVLPDKEYSDYHYDSLLK